MRVVARHSQLSWINHVPQVLVPGADLGFELLSYAGVNLEDSHHGYIPSLPTVAHTPVGSHWC